MRMFEFESRADCAQALADAMAAALRDALDARPAASLALSGGRTPRSVLPLLARCGLDWRRVFITLADDRWVAPADPDSNALLVDVCLLREGAAAARFRPLWSAAATPREGLPAAEASLADVPFPLDVAYLGMGPDGHIASLFPGDDASAFDRAGGRCVTGRAPTPPHERISLSLETLLATRTLFLHLTGEKKRQVFNGASVGAPTPRLPVSLLLHAGHPDLRAFVAP